MMNHNSDKYKLIPGFPLYGVHEDGYVINLQTGAILRGAKKKTGYREVILCDENHKHHYRLVHRIIADAFCEKEPGATEVNHINGIKDDNRAKNLEWVTRAENLNHAYKTNLMPNDTTPREVTATNMDTGEKSSFPSIYKAAKFLGVSKGNICMCCKGLRPYAGGYLWEYT